VSWYDSVYQPLMDVAGDHDLQSRLPGWTDADIYLELTRLWHDLDEEGRPAGPEDAAAALLADPPAIAPTGRLLRGTGHLFRWRRSRP